MIMNKNKFKLMSFWDFILGIAQMIVFWVTTLCTIVSLFHHCGWTCCLHP